VKLHELFQDNLNELFGVKKYKDATKSEVIRDLENRGIEWVGQGKYSTILGSAKWNYVYKFFERDDSYLRFVRFAIKTPHSAFPKFLSKPKKIVPFYKRSVKNPYVYVIKIEKLETIKDKELLKWIVYHLENEASKLFNQTPATVFTIAPEERKFKNRGDEYAVKAKEIYYKYPQLKTLVEGFYLLMKHDFKDSHDIHEGNFMQRADGSLVIIDPLWTGETFYAMHDRLMQAEYFMDDDEYEEEKPWEWLPGNSLKPYGKKPKDKPYKPDHNDYNDLPF